jgi:hypothetical protein
VAAGTICGGSCAGTCDGAGACSDTGVGVCSGGFACDPTGACRTSCTAKTDCQPNFDCNTTSGLCERVPESDCFDGVDNNGDGLPDCQDPTCLGTTATCVPAVGAGAVIGTVVNTLPCPAGFGGATTPLNAGIRSGSCTGCGCTTECTGNFSVYASDGCTGTATSRGSTTGINGDQSTCTNNSNVAVRSMKITSLTRSGCRGSGSSTWQAAAPAWDTSKVFCSVSRTSTTCGQNQLCVPKVATGISSKVSSAGSCPAGYTGAQATYYTGYTNGSCSSCSSCTASTTFNCGALAFAFTGSDACAGSNEFTSGVIPTYSTDSCKNFGATLTVSSMRLDWFSFDGDACRSNVTQNVAPTPTNGQLLCNAP